MADPSSSDQPTTSASLRCIVVTPEKTALDTQADFVALPLFDGEVGIAPLHSPLIGRLGYGELRVKQGGKSTTYYVDGGFVQVIDNVVSVLTNRAIAGSDVQAEAAQQQLQEAIQRRATTDEAFAERDRQIAQSRAQLRVARHSE